jgi:hypothetical protein
LAASIALSLAGAGAFGSPISTDRLGRVAAIIAQGCLR